MNNIQMSGDVVVPRVLFNEIIASIPARRQSGSLYQRLNVLIVENPSCKGKNCGATDGVSHSPECQAEHEATVNPGGKYTAAGQDAQLANVHAGEQVSSGSSIVTPAPAAALRAPVPYISNSDWRAWCRLARIEAAQVVAEQATHKQGALKAQADGWQVVAEAAVARCTAWQIQWDALQERCAKIEAETIERCAKVCNGCNQHSLAQAIRALANESAAATQTRYTGKSETPRLAPAARP